ncbi:unnamed protein product, partial [Menidia menidia]
DLYHQSYESVCVMFASIPDFKEFYTESDKPQYDIWGNSVNVASRMETTGVLGKIQEHDRQYMHIGTMVEFAFALVGKLDKPQYDIWGNSVNVASRMETTGVLGKIQ